MKTQTINKLLFILNSFVILLICGLIAAGVFNLFSVVIGVVLFGTILGTAKSVDELCQ